MLEQNGQVWYKPSEIAKRELIKNSVGKGDYRYVLRLIKRGSLHAEQWNVTGDKPYFVISQEEIDRYNGARFTGTLKK